MEAFCKAFFPFFFDGFVVGSRDSFLVLENKTSPGAALFFPLVLTGGGWVKQQKMRIMSMASTFFKCFYVPGPFF